MSLGTGDEDDRQFPERIQLKRPDGLLRSFYESYCAYHDLDEPDETLTLDDIPILVKERPLVIKDVIMSKFHSAVLTTDPISNLYICGVGRGGRLGLGEENTQFRFVPVQGPLADRKIEHVALGQNHTLAVTSNGELWTWGLNTDSQLGYVLPAPPKADEEAMCATPRQLFGSLKKEAIVGVAASAIHSVAHTGTSLYCWGRNAGQLALMDSDSRSLEIQTTPRKVAASLLTAPIEMVSAIDSATTCLLANHTVWVFTNYGYNLVKFPLPDVFVNFQSTGSFRSRMHPQRRGISHITSGGETVAAVTASGDLFTMHVSQNGDLARTATSTTNPTKIRSALSQPQCIWNSRKDGVVSVNVGEHGSVVICTRSGAVWKRVKRSKGKAAAFAGLSDAKRNDFKFERVPSITNCVGARSSIFGAFAAIRKDSTVMSDQIKVDDKCLKDDIGALFPLSDFKASITQETRAQAAWEAAIAREKSSSISYEVLRSDDIERDLHGWLQAHQLQHDNFDMHICSSSYPEVRIPIHSWVLTARSPALRVALSDFEEAGIDPGSGAFTMAKSGMKTVLTFVSLDIYTILNVVLFIYHDAMVPVWKYTKEKPVHSYRFRQVRTELMKTATVLRLPRLEAAARLQTGLEASLDTDMRLAIEDPQFFHDSDVIIELDGDEVPAHSQLLCQRCPFFKGMFFGRSNGQWLASRQESLTHDEKLRVDLGHMAPETFQYVMEFIYADRGADIFDTVTAADIDEFSEIVLDVMSAANELMLDRLSQICQSVLGKFVTTRNISLLLNEISPCSVTSFKDAGLEYLCLQLESMLENHLLDDLDEDLSLELDEAVRDNQLAHFPFARSRRAELLLHEKYPDLAADVIEERQVRVKEMAFKAAQAAQVGRNTPFSPTLRPKKSTADMIFDMDDDTLADSPKLRASDGRIELDNEPITQLPKSWQQGKAKDVAQSMGSSLGTTPVRTPVLSSTRPEMESPPQRGFQIGAKQSAPWAPTPLSTSKLDLKGIMSETGSGSALSTGLAAQKAKESTASPKPQTKVSQKERKRQMQAQAEAQAADKVQQASHTPWETVSGKRPAPWKTPSSSSNTPAKETLPSPSAARPVPAPAVKPSVASEAGAKLSKTRTASPDTRFSGQGRAHTTPAVPSSSGPRQSRKPLIPHSQSYTTRPPKPEMPLGLSMADIMGQQTREQELVKEAVSKRSLQEIQQEQEFQEWWDQESRRTQEEEAKRLSKGNDKAGAARGRRGRGGKPRAGDKGSTPQSGEASASERPRDQSKKGKAVRGRGRKA
jgi:inhibitor of Bruton tyrosine kinase